jgi:hypothetical protein
VKTSKTDYMGRSRTRKALYFIITLAVIFILIEGILSIFVYQKTGPEKLASIEALKSIKKLFYVKEYSLNVTNHNLTRPDSSEKVNHAIAEETIKSNTFVYKSWVEFKMKDFEGKYMNMNDAVRQSSPSEFINGSNDTLDIYFLGGSTMFGFNVLDHETIPSQFLTLYKQKFPNGKSVRVFNYGTPTYYSYQELILLSDLIFKNHKPSLVVLLDGINDFWFVKASYYRQSYFSYIFRQMFTNGLRSKGDFRFIDTADAMYKDPQNIPATEYYRTLIENYVENMKNIRMMADMVGARPYFFCQPSPFYNYPNQQKDPMCFKDTNTRFNYIYPMLEKMADTLPDFTFLGNMLKSEKGYPFIDGLHYSPRFITKLTERILSTIEPELSKTDTTKVAGRYTHVSD